MAPPTLAELLAKALPKHSQWTLHHVSTPPTKCSPIFAAPPGQQPEETYCESHFFSISHGHVDRLLQVFAIEVLIYATKRLTTLFVSKADSTGFMRSFRLPKDTQSPLKTAATIVLQFLVRERTRCDRLTVLSLFARSQSQYLFPGSADNGHKSIRDDRALIKWWCQVADLVLLAHDSTIGSNNIPQEAQGYLRVPGYEAHETRHLIDGGKLGTCAVNPRWKATDPLREIASAPNLPERCLIPRFPDDPKARYVETLDEELPDYEFDGPPPKATVHRPEVPLNSPSAGKWRSIRSLNQFWEAMSFRQECSSGRLVGFLWVVFTPVGLKSPKISVNRLDAPAQSTLLSLSIPTFQKDKISESNKISTTPQGSSLTLSSPHAPPQTTQSPVMKEVNEDVGLQVEKAEHFYWPASSRGEVVLRKSDYDRVQSLMLRRDYSNERDARDSAKMWINEVGTRASVQSWGQYIVGEAETTQENTPSTKRDTEALEVNVLGTSLVKKKKKRPASNDDPAMEGPANSQPFKSLKMDDATYAKQAQRSAEASPE